MSAYPTRRAVLFAGAATAITRRAAAADVPSAAYSWSPGQGNVRGRTGSPSKTLHRLGYVGGRNLAIDYILRAFEMSPPALTEAIGVQIGHGAEVVIASGSEHTLAAATAATRIVPIVMIAVDFDPLAKGYFASLARPGGNITGVTLQTIEVTAKRLDLFKQAVPGMRCVAILWDPESADTYESARQAAAALDLPAVSVEFRDTPYDYERALAAAGTGPGDGLMVMSSGLFVPDREKLSKLALHLGLPLLSGRDWPDVGALMSFGVDINGMARLAARYVDKILKGAKPADLPVEQPTRFELVINLKTAKALGLTIPPAILARADEVIE